MRTQVNTIHSLPDLGRPILELSSVEAGYDKVTVLRDVDLVIRPGSLVALLGPNGAGKTTALRTAAGFIRPSSGSVYVDGANVTHQGPHRRARAGVCHVPEGRGIFRSLTVKDNLEIATPPWRRGAKLDEVFEVFPILKDRRTQTAGTLSGGQQQMLALARAFLASPRIVLLDEVSMGLAPLVVDEIFESVDLLRASGVAILLVEQYVNRALEIADHVYMIDRGRIGFSGPPSELDVEEVTRGYLGVE